MFTKKELLGAGIATMMLPLTVNAEVLITEVFYDTPGSDSYEEWIEITNTGCSTQSLTGWSLSDNNKTYTLSGSLQANQSLVVARNSSGFNSLYSTSPDKSNLNLSLGNSGDFVELRNQTQTVDLVAWENKVPGWNIQARYNSIYRNSPNDTDSVSDWEVSSGYGNPGSYDYTDSSCNSSPSDDYYQDARGLSGEALKSKLAEIASRNHSYMTYSQVWDALNYTDQDLTNSDNVILFYSGRSQDKGYRSGIFNDGNAWNREHIWPKSLGFPRTSQWGYTDIHHLRPADASINSTRSNKDYDDGGTSVTESPQNRRDSDSFEPRAAVKGDAARMIFYMAVRYAGQDGNMPDLYLVDDTSSSTGSPKFGKLCTLVQWSKDDPVDSWERQRHEKVVEVQGNRNPFIDRPDFVEALYGADCR